jgi:hypothetical protein
MRHATYGPISHKIGKTHEGATIPYQVPAEPESWESMSLCYVSDNSVASSEHVIIIITKKCEMGRACRRHGR